MSPPPKIHRLIIGGRIASRMSPGLPKSRLRRAAAASKNNNADDQNVMGSASSKISKEMRVPAAAKKMKSGPRVSTVSSRSKRTTTKSDNPHEEDGPPAADPVQDSSLQGGPPQNDCQISKLDGEYKILDKEFFQCDSLELAPRLLGKFLRRDDVVLQITEVEAYRQNDTACHGHHGLTPRTAPMFGPGGHAYCYLCYGVHTMLNVVADKEGICAAVLIRSCAPVSGLETIQRRRGQMTDKPVLLTGPGKVGKALGLTKEWSNHPLYTHGGLEVLDGPAPEKILVGPRVGIAYASPKDVAALWRFCIAGSAWISAPHNTLRPP